MSVQRACLPVGPAAVTGPTSQHKHRGKIAQNTITGSHKIRFSESAGARGALTKQSHVDKTRQEEHLTFAL